LERAPEKSNVDINNVVVDQDTMLMLEKIGMHDLKALNVVGRR